MLLLRNIQSDEIIKNVFLNVAQFSHAFYLSLTSQRLIDYSDGTQEIMFILREQFRIELVRICDIEFLYLHTHTHTHTYIYIHIYILSVQIVVGFRFHTTEITI